MKAQSAALLKSGLSILIKFGTRNHLSYKITYKYILNFKTSYSFFP